MNSVTQLSDWRSTSPAGAAPLVCSDCGGSWFELYTTQADGTRAHGAVVLDRRGRITGYGGTPHCVSCGHEELP